MCADVLDDLEEVTGREALDWVWVWAVDTEGSTLYRYVWIAHTKYDTSHSHCIALQMFCGDVVSVVSECDTVVSTTHGICR